MSRAAQQEAARRRALTAAQPLAASSFFCVDAGAATSPAFFADNKVMARVGMTIGAMRFGSLPFAVGFPAKRKPRNINALIGVHDLSVSQAFSCASNNSVSFHSRLLSKINGAILFALNLNVNRAALVPLLGFFTRPSTVLWRVVSIVVDAVKRVSFGPLAHIRHKLMKIINPCVTNGNAAPSVIRIGAGIGIKASLLHALPNVVKWVLVFERHNAPPAITHTTQEQPCKG